MTVPIFTMGLAQKLLNEGFKIVGLANNTRNTNLVVFHFERNEELIRVLQDKYNVNWS